MALEARPGLLCPHLVIEGVVFLGLPWHFYSVKIEILIVS